MSDSNRQQRFCEQCGTQTRAGYSFCVGCGVRVDDETLQKRATGTDDTKGGITRKSGSDGEQNLFQIIVYALAGIFLVVISSIVFSYSVFLGIVFLVFIGFSAISIRRSRNTHTQLEGEILEKTDRLKDSVSSSYRRGDHKEFAQNIHQRSRAAYEEANTRYREWDKERSFNRELPELEDLWHRCELFFMAAGTGTHYFRGWMDDYEFELEGEEKNVVQYLTQAQGYVEEGLNWIQECQRVSSGAHEGSSDRDHLLSKSEGLRNKVTDTVEVFRRFRSDMGSIEGWDEYKRKLDVFLAEFVQLPDHDSFTDDQNSRLERLLRHVERGKFHDPHRVPGMQGNSPRKTVATATFDELTVSTLTVRELLYLIYEVADEVDRAGYWEGSVEIRDNVSKNLTRFLSRIAIADKVGQEGLEDIECAKLDVLYEALPDTERKDTDYCQLNFTIYSNIKSGVREVPDFLHAMVEYDQGYGTEYCVAVPVLVEHIGRNMSNAGGVESQLQDTQIFGDVFNLRRFVRSAGFNASYGSRSNGSKTIESNGIVVVDPTEVEAIKEESQNTDAVTLKSINRDIAEAGTVAVIAELDKVAQRVKQEGYWQGDEAIEENLLWYVLRLLSVIAVADGRLRDSDLDILGGVIEKLSGEKLEDSRVREHVRDRLRESQGFTRQIPNFLRSFADYDRDTGSMNSAASVKLLGTLGEMVAGTMEGSSREEKVNTLGQILGSYREFLKSEGVPVHYDSESTEG